ncbi:putative small nuclear ribonucleoprotein [Leishmania mexicana MHOM/GT/2001/U1103]|uniref:Small nuclear ribonucleoprotein Sm D3 n=1 Tax=Leishmania mexicana (strain MHOM/GT/2001/U1103) TaxID=929439 RepID=E9B5H9_LEIMU|nr:putative small nuclear ribonucleoprotein [Leishmania mexicana MHOM/GT/2001/U1103]CBZ30499.1 putative small nuclear ribonucleoprotein [Leishmania mexicana MHOM/GT/2001/U1103]
MAESIPIKVLYDALHLKVSIEVATGEVYHGTVEELQNNMNVLLKNATKTARGGKETKMDSVFVRGSNIVFFQLPDALQTSPALLRAGEVVSKAKDTRGDGKGFGASRKRARNS